MTALSLRFGSYVILLREKECPRPSCACSTSSSAKSERYSAKCIRTPRINSKIFSSEDTLMSICFAIILERLRSDTPKSILVLLLGSFDSRKSTSVGVSSESFKTLISLSANSVLLNF